MSGPSHAVDPDPSSLSTQRQPRQVRAPRRVGLPETIQACLFDLDGVLTRTAVVHNAAWTETFDSYLRDRAQGRAEGFVPFDPRSDYENFVDGKKREDGVRDFLASRGIVLDEGTPDDPPDRETFHGLGNRKNLLLLRLIDEDGVEVYDGSRRYLAAVRDAGLRVAVVSSSANTVQVLEVTGLAPSIEVVVDAVVARERGVAGKPAPDTFLEAARMLDVEPAQAVVFEDALAGVTAGRAGRFGLVVGVDRVGQTEALRARGADLVVPDLQELL
jgi:beta-phosphoglucomutase family hydrolase